MLQLVLLLPVKSFSGTPLRQLFPIFLLLPFTAIAQTTCPARTVNLKPTATSHIDLVRQPDASYTAFEVPDAPPYSVLHTTPHFVELQFAACLPPASSPPAPAPPANPIGAASQLQVAAPLPSGNYFTARISSDNATIFFDIFDAQHNLLSEKPFTATVSYEPAGTSYDLFESLALADLNQDGQLDLIAGFEVAPCSCSLRNNGVWTFLGNGDGTFQPGVQETLVTAAPFSTLATSLGDLNGDGKPDLALTGANQASLTLASGNGDGTFSPPTSVFPLLSGQTLVLVDVNGDGKLDLVSASTINSQDQPVVAVALGDGKGGFQAPAVYSVRLPKSLNTALVATGDINGDGFPDIVTSGGTVLLNDGKGGFPSRKDYILPLASGSIILADLNGDGHLDILIGNGNPLFLSGTTAAPSLTVLFGNGTGIFSDAPTGGLTVVSGAGFLPGPLAPNSIVAAFGNNILAGQPSSAAPPLPTMLSGISVNVEDSTGVTRSAPLYFVSMNQVNFIVPPGTAPGTAVVTLAGPAQPLTAVIQITPLAPELFTAGANLAAAYAVRVSPDGTQTILPLYNAQPLSVVPIPLDLTQPGQVYLILFGTGFDTVAPGNTYATIAGVNAAVTYAGPQPSYPGLDQINILIPSALAGAGSVKVAVSMGAGVLNTVLMTIR
jgi:uncharacterized protein (TIGR03437 family)